MKFIKKLLVLLCCTLLMFTACDRENYFMNSEVKKAEKRNFTTPITESLFITPSMATKVANNFLNKRETNKNTLKLFSTSKRFSSIKPILSGNDTLMYIINYKNEGFVIVGALRDYYPILAYSFSNNFEIENASYDVKEWIENTKSSIKASTLEKDSIKGRMYSLWHSYDNSGIKTYTNTTNYHATRSNDYKGLNECINRCDEYAINHGDGWYFSPLSEAKSAFYDAGFSAQYDNLCYSAKFNHSPEYASVVGWKIVREEKKTGPLLTTEWGQGEPYNELCEGNPAGCAAIALSQVMDFYKHPQSFSYNGVSFDWSHIYDDPNGKSNSANALLVRLVGNAINTHYHSKYSFATPGDVENGIKDLGYNVSKEGFNYDKVELELLNHERPVIMLGNDDNLSFLPGDLKYIGNSHYWVCDGAKTITTNRLVYFTEWQPYCKGDFVPGWGTFENPTVFGGVVYLYYHMNWGWKGKDNGWFAFNDIKNTKGDYKNSIKVFYISKR